MKKLSRGEYSGKKSSLAAFFNGRWRHIRSWLPKIGLSFISLKLLLLDFEIMAEEKAEWGTLFRYVEHFCQSINL